VSDTLEIGLLRWKEPMRKKKFFQISLDCIGSLNLKLICLVVWYDIFVLTESNCLCILELFNICFYLLTLTCDFCALYRNYFLCPFYVGVTNCVLSLPCSANWRVHCCHVFGISSLTILSHWITFWVFWKFLVHPDYCLLEKCKRILIELILLISTY
jgi:hypothetical protein